MYEKSLGVIGAKEGKKKRPTGMTHGTFLILCEPFSDGLAERG